MNGPPCKGCPKRYVGCHSECDVYQAYATQRAAYLENRRIEKDLLATTRAGAKKATIKKLKKDGKI